VAAICLQFTPPPTTRPTTRPTIGEPSASQQGDDQAQQIWEAYQTFRNSNAGVEAPIDFFHSPDEFSSFFRETKALDFLKGKRPSLLFSLLGQGDEPSPKEGLNWGLLHEALMLNLELGEASISFLSRDSLAALNSFSDQEISLRSFKNLQKVESLVKYGGVLLNFFKFLLNSYDLQVS
jgi:hypothetical protein